MIDNNFVKKIIIPGEYWDSFIYKKWLILESMDGTLRSYDWEKFITEELDYSNNELAYNCAFLQGNALYRNTGKSILFKDSEVKNLLEEKFKRIKNIDIDYYRISRYATFNQPTEINNLTTDIGIYNDKLYYCNSDGVFCTNLSSRNINYVSRNINKIWDGYVQNLQVGNYGTIIMSAASDGLFDLITNENYNDEHYYNTIGGKTIEHNIHQLSSNHSSYCSWSFSSILSGSFVDKSFMIGTEYKYNDNVKLKCGIIKEEKDIFNSSIKDGLLFSNNDKIYRLSKSKIEKVDFKQYQMNNKPFSNLEEQEYLFEDEVVSSAVSDFGLIVETTKQLLVFLSDNNKLVLADNDEEEFITWRIFPRSKRYINQIHVVYDNRIEIISVNSDYFVNQKKKFYGSSVHDLK